MEKLTELEALNKAISIAGGQAALCEKIGLNRNASNVGVMVNRDKKASASYALKIHKATGVPLHQLRPDLYPEPANDDSNSPNIA